MGYKLFLVSVFFVLSGCSSNLINDIYKYTESGNDETAQTAFIILSNMKLREPDIEKIKSDYSGEADIARKFLYEYVLAKRTQEEQYVLSFIKSAERNFPILLNNTSNWVSIGSPVLDQLSMYSYTDDDALSVLLKLVLESDGANQSIVASDLRDVYEVNPQRFLNVVKRMNLDVKSIMLLMEDE
ncbi:MAG: hypothetical protein COA42_05005 [Alteromonadaceae bacterium]|nr:MAG: hypothetical protein COA42_05005 [Alteromonadaceae bacterium]